MEDLDRTLPSALKEFLSLEEDVRLIKPNLTTDKDFADVYRIVKEKLIAPAEYLEKIRNTDYYRKLYSE